MANTSRLGVASLLLGIFSMVNVGVFAYVSCIHQYFREPIRTLLLDSYERTSLLSGVFAIALGLGSFVRITRSRGMLKGRSYGAAGAFLGVVAASLILLPYACSPDRGHKLFSASSCLNTICSQEAIFKQQCEVDQDADEVGEYGFLCELSAEIAPRKKEATGPVCPAYISDEYATGGGSGKGIAQRSGYLFRVYLPGNDGNPMDDRFCDGTAAKPSTTLDPKTDKVAIDMQENHFVVYAWPVNANETGGRAFVVNERGQVYATQMQKKVYSGPNDGPSIEAAFSAKGNGADGWFNDKLASGPDDPGNDGNIWNPAW